MKIELLLNTSKMNVLLILSVLSILAGCQKEDDFQKIHEISLVIPYQDVRWGDLRKAELDSALIKTLSFNESTIWPDQFKPIAINLLSRAKNPGLGIRALHQQGITGKGVGVAIIDQNICLDHPEYFNKIKQYKDVGCGQPANSSSFHGPAVASLLVGDSIGTAPDATLYFVAAPSWTKDARFQADALNWILDKNLTLPEGEKIRAVSISAAPSGPGSPFTKNNALWDAAYSRAVDQGVLVIDCTRDHGITYPAFSDIEDPENVSKYTAGFPGISPVIDQNRICVPNSLRTIAEQFNKGEYSYCYTGRGGLSWAEPYLVGVLALGWQLKPNITGDEMIRLIFESAYVGENGAKMINPAAFIESVNAFSHLENKMNNLKMK